jgi:hypothetical protein
MIYKCKGWFNHRIHNPRNFHFLSAMSKSVLEKVGGFCNEMAYGMLDHPLRDYDDIGTKLKFVYGRLTDLFLTKDKRLVNIEDKEINVITEVTNDLLAEKYVDFMARNLRVSKKARSILYYIIGHSKMTDDICVIDMEKLKDITGYSSLGPIYAAFNELIDIQLLARSKYDDQYFINPNFIYNKMSGTKMVNQYIINVYTEPGIDYRPSAAPVKEKESLPAGFSNSDLEDPLEDY